MMTPTEFAAPTVIRSIAAKLALALVLAATPLAAIGFASLDNVQVSFAGGSNPDDVDPG
ncbi:MAG: hypothetical protein WD314_00380 [Trueperaceae bacterium]